MTNNESVRGQIDQAADRFDAALQRGETPRIEDFLAGWTGPDRTQLLNELLRMELEFLGQSSKRPSEETFIERFPQDTELVRRVFQEEVADRFKLDDTAARSADESTVRRDPSLSAPTSPHLPAASTPSPGTFGDYELLEEIARGGMGVVYKARQTSLNRIVALKMIKSGELAGHEEVQRFRNEAEAAARLDHPNIVPIHEVGEHDGRHFFSMGYVEGRGLDALLKEGPLPPRDAAALIRTIAEAVQYAHDKGIVHRDLKPANVLLAASGVSIDSQNLDRAETTNVSPADTPRSDTPKITDFGLAKNISADSGMTATGQILGTPSYMPPEQASGQSDEVGPLSDVYSLGAMLYATLTGRPPFQAASVMETLKQVADQEPVSPRALNPGVDRDLETICLKCMQKDAGKRYASAQSLVDELDRFLTHKPIHARPVGRIERGMRWSRRNPLGTTVIGLMLFLAVAGPAIAIVQTETNRRLDDALTREKQSSLLARQATATAQRKAKETATALQKVKIALHNERSALQRKDQALLETRNTINAYVETVKSAELLKESRFKPLLKELLKDAIAHYQRFIQEHQNEQSLPTRLRIANAFTEIGFLSSRMGSQSSALNAYREAIRIRNQLLQQHPSVPELHLDFAMNHASIGLVLQTIGKQEEALSAYRRGLLFISQRSREQQDNFRYRTVLGDIHNGIGTVHYESGDYEEAMAEFRVALNIRKKVAEETPDETDNQQNLATTLNNIGILHTIQGRPSEALSAYQDALKILSKLARDQPGVTEYQSSLARTNINIGNLYRMTGSANKALVAYRNAQTVFTNLADANPSITDFQMNLAGAYNNIGILLFATGKQTEAVSAYERSVEIYDCLVREHPTVKEFQINLAATLSNFGVHLNRSGKKTEAFAALRRSLRIRNMLSREYPAHSEYRSGLARVHNTIGNVHRDTGKLVKAVAEYRRSAQIFATLARENPAVVAYRRSLGALHDKIGVRLKQLDRLAEAQKAFTRAVEVRESVVRDHPTDIDYCRELFLTQNNLSNIYRITGRPLDALKLVERTIRLSTSTLNHHPRQKRLRESCKHSRVIRAMTLDDLSRSSEAIQEWTRALSLDSGQSEAWIRRKLAFSLARAGRHKEAVELANQLLVATRRANDGYELVWVYAVSAAITRRDESPRSSKRRSDNSRKAIAILKGLERAGFFQLARNRLLLQSDPHLNPLRHRDDFRQFGKSIGLASPAWAVRPRSMLLLRATRPVVARRPQSAE